MHHPPIQPHRQAAQPGGEAAVGRRHPDRPLQDAEQDLIDPADLRGFAWELLNLDGGYTMASRVWGSSVMLTRIDLDDLGAAVEVTLSVGEGTLDVAAGTTGVVVTTRRAARGSGVSSRRTAPGSPRSSASPARRNWRPTRSRATFYGESTWDATSARGPTTPSSSSTIWMATAGPRSPARRPTARSTVWSTSR